MPADIEAPWLCLITLGCLQADVLWRSVSDLPAGSGTLATLRLTYLEYTLSSYRVGPLRLLEYLRQHPREHPGAGHVEGVVFANILECTVITPQESLVGL